MHGHEVRKLSRPPKRIVGLAARVHHSADGASSAIQAARRLTRGSWRRAREGVERKKLQPHGWHTVTPRIICKDAEGLVDFIKRVFGATGDFVQGRPAEVRIGDSVVMVSAAGERECFPAFLYVYVPDADSTYLRALSAKATSLEEPADMPYGDRRAMVRDEWSNVWQIATRGRTT